MYNKTMDKLKDIHKYIWVEFGIWVFILLALLIGIRIHGYHASKQLTSYQIFLPDVDGLIVGSPVRYLGVQVGYVDKIKIISDEIYVKFVITEKDLQLPKGVIATVEFNGMGGSKSLEVYPPTKESIASDKIILVANPVRLHDAMALLDHMFDKIGSITSRISYFANETGATDMKNSGLDIEKMESNMNMFDKILKNFKRSDENDKAVK